MVVMDPKLCDSKEILKLVQKVGYSFVRPKWTFSRPRWCFARPVLSYSKCETHGWLLRHVGPTSWIIQIWSSKTSHRSSKMSLRSSKKTSPTFWKRVKISMESHSLEVYQDYFEKYDFFYYKVNALWDKYLLLKLALKNA